MLAWVSFRLRCFCVVSYWFSPPPWYVHHWKLCFFVHDFFQHFFLTKVCHWLSVSRCLSSFSSKTHFIERHFQLFSWISPFSQSRLMEPGIIFQLQLSYSFQSAILYFFWSSFVSTVTFSHFTITTISNSFEKNSLHFSSFQAWHQTYLFLRLQFVSHEISTSLVLPSYTWCFLSAFSHPLHPFVSYYQPCLLCFVTILKHPEIPSADVRLVWKLNTFTRSVWPRVKIIDRLDLIKGMFYILFLRRHAIFCRDIVLNCLNLREDFSCPFSDVELLGLHAIVATVQWLSELAPLLYTEHTSASFRDNNPVGMSEIDVVPS